MEDDIEFTRRLGELVDRVRKMRGNQCYDVNEEQMEKVRKILEFYQDADVFYHAEVPEIDLEPEFGIGGLIMRFKLMSANGAEEVQRFCDAMSACSAIAIETTTDGKAILDCTVPNVFVPKVSHD